MEADTPFAEEIANVLELYGARARVTTPSGFGQPCLSVHPVPSRHSVELDLQLHDTYPHELPTISFEGLPNSEAEALHNELERVAKERSGSPMLVALLAVAAAWIREHSTRPPLIQQSPDTPVPDSSNAEVPSIAENSQRAVSGPKADRMRTASDVIGRIRWDDQLDESDFIVTYLDRFRGAIETPFSEVDWDDAPFPQHRIQCFAFRGVPVWDKRVPLDHVFGSRGDGQKIEDVMQHLNEGDSVSAP